MATQTVTILFCDLVGSTKLLTRLGDDANDRVRRDFFEAMREQISARGGVEVKTNGDNIMASFTTSAADAVSAAVAMQRAVARLNDRDPLLGLSVRIGLALGDANFEENDWFGAPVVEASRLEALARPHQILVSDVIRAVVGSRGGHTFTSVGTLELRGLPEPVPASEVAWEPDPGLPAIPLPSGLERSGLRFVGREDALDSLRRAWNDATGGRPRLVLIEGEPGIGKSRLTAEFAARVHADETIVLFGRSEVDRELPYQPFAEALRWYALAASPRTLREQVGDHGAELARFVPALRQRVPELPEAAPSDPETERIRLFEGVAQLLRNASDQAPVLLVIDDLAQAGTPTRAMLRHILRRAASARLLVIGLAETGTAADLAGESGVERIDLEGLTTADLQAIVEGETGARDGTVSLAERLRAETEGHPGFAAELIARLRDAGSFEVSTLDDATTSLSQRAAEVFESACPYMGLRSFEPEDAALYFGREDDVAALLGRLAGARLLSVVGASGSGKSSLVRAGLIPALQRGALPGSADWQVVLLTPGEHPLRELASRLARYTASTAPALLEDFERDPRSLDVVVREALSDAPAGARMLLVVDQFEELFTLARDEEERRRFVDALLSAVTVPGGRTVAALAMRADFYGEAAGYAGFADALEVSQALLGPMNEEQLRATVERPADAAGLRLAPGLAHLILGDVGTEPGGLPLLSHALLETWKRREGRELTVAGYRAAGGVRGAIAQTADAVFETLTLPEQAAARNLFVRLTELGEGTEDTRRRAAFAEVAPAGDDGHPMRALIGTLADARLITTGEDTVEVSHEALIREWPRLRGWLDDDREGLRLLRHITESAHSWDELDRDDGELYRGSRLAATQEWLETAAPELTDLERAFIDASVELSIREEREAEKRVRRQARQNRILRAALGGIGLLFLVAIVGAGIAWQQRQDAADARDEARAAQSVAESERADAETARAQEVEAREAAEVQRQEALAAALDATLARIGAEIPNLLETDRSLAMLLAVEGRRLRDSVSSRALIQSTLVDDPRFVGYLDGSVAPGFVETPGSFVWTAVSPSGRLLAVKEPGGPVRLWDLEERALLVEAEGGETSSDRSFLWLGFSPDESLLAAGEVSSLSLYRVPSLELVWTVPIEYSAIDPRFSLDGRTISVSSRAVLDDQTVPSAIHLIDVERGGLLASWRPPADDFVSDYDRTADDSRLAIGLFSGRVVMLSSDTLEEVAEFSTQRLEDRAEVLNSLAASRAGTLIATVGRVDNVVRLWDTNTFEPVEPSFAICGGVPGCIPRDLVFSPDGSQLATLDSALGLVIWDAQTGSATSEPVHSQRGTPHHVEFTSDGTLIVTTWDQGIALWDPAGGGLISRQLPPEARGTAELSVDGSQLAVQAADGSWTLWDTDTLQPVASSVDAPGGRSNSPRFSADGRFLVTTHSSGCTGILEPCQGYVAVWNAADGTLAMEPIPVRKRLNFLPIAVDRDLLAIGADDGTVRFWDLASLQPVGDPLPVSFRSLPPGGLWVALVTTGERGGVPLMAALQASGDLSVWDLSSSVPRRILEHEFGPLVASSLAFGPDGTLAIGFRDGTINLVDPTTLESVGPSLAAENDRSSVYAMRFSADGRFLAAGGNISNPPNPSHVFDLARGQAVGASFGLGLRDRPIAPDGSFVVIPSESGVMITSLDPDYWESQACLAAGRNLSQQEWDEFFPRRPYEATCPQWPSGAE